MDPEPEDEAQDHQPGQAHSTERAPRYERECQKYRGATEKLDRADEDADRRRAVPREPFPQARPQQDAGSSVQRREITDERQAHEEHPTVDHTGRGCRPARSVRPGSRRAVAESPQVSALSAPDRDVATG